MTKLKIQHSQVGLAYRDQGTGPPLVLLHGFPLDHTMWNSQINALSTTCRVIAPDLRGFGNSPLSKGDAERGIDMAEYAADVLALLDELVGDDPVILCGFSMGGYVLWQFVLQYPTRVRALVLSDTKAANDSDDARQTRLDAAKAVMCAGVGPVAEAMLPKLLSPTTLAHRRELVEQVDTMIRATAPEAVAAAQRGMARRPDVRENLAELTLPTLVIVGAEDAISPPAEMVAIAAAMPRARYIEVSQAGHLAPLENPKVVNDEMLFFVASLK